MIADMIINIYSGLYIIGFFSLALPMAMVCKSALINWLTA
jgi:hypothetical protein